VLEFGGEETNKRKENTDREKANLTISFCPFFALLECICHH